MDPNTLLLIMAVFVFVSAVALSIQAGFLFGIYKASRGVQLSTERLVPKVESLIETSRLTVDQSRKQIVEITAKTTDILDITRRQLERVDEVMGDATVRARIQLEHAEMVIDDTMNRAHETVAIVHGGIMKPLREIQGVAAGLHAALQYLSRGRRPDPNHVTSDEEMFI